MPGAIFQGLQETEEGRAGWTTGGTVGWGWEGAVRHFLVSDLGLVSKRTWMVRSLCWSGLFSELSKGLFTGSVLLGLLSPTLG